MYVQYVRTFLLWGLLNEVGTLIQQQTTKNIL